MLKKITIFYSSIMLIMLFVVMVVMIVITLIHIDHNLKTLNKSPKIVNNNIYKKNNNDKKVFKITTDKNIYTADEKVVITFENLSSSNLAQHKDSSLTIKCRRDIGDNYEVAFIEHKEGDEWVAIEPVSRCSDNCRKSCSDNKKINSKEKATFVWSQTVLKCSDDTSLTDKAPFGSYRVSSASWDSQSSSFVRVSSGIFKISSISKDY